MEISSYRCLDSRWSLDMTHEHHFHYRCKLVYHTQKNYLHTPAMSTHPQPLVISTIPAISPPLPYQPYPSHHLPLRHVKRSRAITLLVMSSVVVPSPPCHVERSRDISNHRFCFFTKNFYLCTNFILNQNIYEKKQDCICPCVLCLNCCCFVYLVSGGIDYSSATSTHSRLLCRWRSDTHNHAF